jgi:spore germination protein GerM
VQVFFVRYEGGGHSGTLVPVRHPAKRGEAEERLSSALRDLLAGPTPDERRRGLTSEIPSGTGLRGVRVGQGIVTVDLTSAFGRGGGSTSMLARVWQVVYTASQLPGTPDVQILLDGRRVPALGGEGVMIGTPLRRPHAIPVF